MPGAVPCASTNPMPVAASEPPRPWEGEVSTVSWPGDHLKRIRVRGGASLLLPRSACVTEGNTVRMDTQGRAWLIGPGGRAVVQLAPCYWAEDRVQVGDLDLRLVVKEVTEADEFEAYRSLTRFHYRDETLFGRTARLIVRSFHPLYPEVIGYVELTSPFYMNKARSRFLDAPFKHSGVQWDAWDLSAQKRHIHRVVRIARCVVYPEFRGLGLGRRLVAHASRFARTRWQAGTLKPLFLEISADMLRFVPFAEAAGMTWIGETEGNLARVATDMGYLLRNRDRVDEGTILDPETHGIVQSQVNRMKRAADLMKELGLSLEAFVERLSGLATSTDLTEVDQFRDLLSLPKPTYLMGLTPAVDAWVHARAEALGLDAAREHWQPAITRPDSPIVVEQVSLTRRSEVLPTARTVEVQRAFGISDGPVEHRVLKDVSLRLSPGEVLLVTGASGSGKSSLLDALQGRVQPTSGHLALPPAARIGTLQPLPSEAPLIEYFSGSGVGVSAALELLGWVGLSDAFVYLKRFGELSAGQQYRAMLGGVLARGENVWVADEFCANLDPITAGVVASRAQQLARRVGAMLIAATAHADNILTALSPDWVLQLTSATESRLVRGQDYVTLTASPRRRFEIPTLRTTPETLTALREGASADLASSVPRPTLAYLRTAGDWEPALLIPTPGGTGSTATRLGAG